MPTLVLSPRVTDDSEAMRVAATRMGWDVERLPNWQVPEHLHQLDVVLYGEVLFVEVVAARLGLALLEAPSAWLTTLPECYLRRRVRSSTLAAARIARERVFVKPADGKCFPAGVFESGAQLPDEARLAGETAVLVSEPVTWEVEYRCFVKERRVAAVTPYIRGGQLAEEPDGTWPAAPGEVEQALAFASALLSDVSVKVPPAAVVDVGIIRDSGWAVVEANAVWASGICGARPEDVLPVARRAVRKPGDLTEEDRPWVRAPVEFES